MSTQTSWKRFTSRTRGFRRAEQLQKYKMGENEFKDTQFGENVVKNKMKIKKTRGNKRYGIKPKYEVYFNKYILGIFKMKSKATRFSRIWKKRHKEYFK